jgi:type IV pilus assembly protein PilM
LTGGLVLEKFAYKEFGGDLQEEEYKVALNEALQEVIAEHNFDNKVVYFSFSGQSAFIRFVKLPPLGEEEGRVRQVVEYEAKQNVPYPMDEVIWDYQLIGDIDDNTEIETMFVVVKNDVINELTKIIEENGKEPVLIDVAPTVAYNSARANGIGEDDCSMILNIGGKCSSLIFIDSGKFFVRPIPIAGFTVTQQISKEFGIPFDDAEELKKKHGFVALGGAYEEPDSEVAATVSKIVRNVMTRLHGEINRSINVYRSQRKGSKPTKLYLAGGSSVMAFTPRFFSEKLKIPVEYFNPFQVVSLAPHIDKEALAEVAHMFSEVIGLGLRHATECPIEISLIPPALKQQQELKKKTPYFYASVASLIVCLGIFWAAVGFNKERSQTMVDTATAVKNRTENNLGLVDEAQEAKDEAQAQYDDAVAMLKGREEWINLLDELQTLLPDNIWLTKISKGSKPSASALTPQRKKKTTGSLMANMFARDTQTVTKTVSPDIEWLEIEGHTLILNKTVSMEQTLKENFVKSKFFTDDKDEVAVPEIKLGHGVNNLSEFKMVIKLKHPIKQ